MTKRILPAVFPLHSGALRMRTLTILGLALAAGTAAAQGGFTPPTFDGLDTDKNGSLSQEEVAKFVATIPDRRPEWSAERRDGLRQLGREQGRLRLARRVRRGAPSRRWRTAARRPSSRLNAEAKGR